MNVTEERAALETEIDRIRNDGLLGSSGTMLRLFNFIAERTLSGPRPNEAEIAIEVFGRSGSFEAGQDAVVRVYVHRLRKRLEDHYIRSATVGVRLSIPRGEYRLILTDAEPNVVDATPVATRGIRKTWLVATVAAGALLIGAGTGYFVGQGNNTEDFVKATVWKAYRKADRPLLVVVGDYYIYGEIDHVGNVSRLVREFSVNSREDLYEQMMIGDAMGEGAVDLGLAYLPVSIAEGLSALAPVLAAHGNTRTITASEFSPQMLQHNDVIYVGYISGMHELEPIVFRGGRFQLGQSYDELVDTNSGERFVSDSARAISPDGNEREFGYFTSIVGPKGNRLTVLAGTRDAGLVGVARAVTDASILRGLKPAASGGVELIVEADGKDHMGGAPKIVAAAGRDAGGNWPAS